MKSHLCEANTASVDVPQAEDMANSVGMGANPASLVHRPLQGLAADVAIGDFDDLLNAIKARLRMTAADLLAAAPESGPADFASRARDSLLECVAGLDQLQTTLKHEPGRRQQLEMEVFNARSELAQARAELVGTQAGERRTRHLAMHDALTSLPNSSYFREQLESALAQAEPKRLALAVLCFDLDGFKLVNDMHGHAAGDELLRIVGARLTRAVRAGDVLGRLGGDEFGCLLVDLPGREQLSQLACKLFDAVSAPFQIGKVRLTVRASIGISMYPEDGASAEALLSNADAAMYRAKRRQTGYAFFDQCAES